MLQVQAGDQDAFRELYDSTCVQVNQAVARTLRAPEHTVEVVQDVYLHAWEHARSFDQARGSVLGWLKTIAHRRAVDRVRHVVRAVSRDQRVAIGHDTPTPDASQLGLANVEADRLHVALRGLSAKQREALVATYLHGWSFPQASQRLRVPVATLKTRARDGLAALRRCYPEASLL